MHRSAIIIKDSMIRRARAETPALLPKLLSQRKVATLMSGEPELSPSRLLYVADKRNKCNYSINTGAAVSVLPRSCANGTADTDILPLVPANNLMITTYGTCK